MPIFENHSVLKPPKENITLWRYMDIPSFLLLLAESSLSLVRADLFEDKNEGRFTEPTEKLINEEARSFHFYGGEKTHSQEMRELFNNVYINCWCITEHELVHMWKIYSKENGIAIKTNYNILNKSIKNDGNNILPGVVSYVDMKNEFVDWQMNILQPYTIKGREYQFENEFRLIQPGLYQIEQTVSTITNVEERNNLRKTLYAKIPVIKCKVNLKSLIKDIYISPYAPEWYIDFLKDILNRYGLKKCKIHQSNLSTKLK